MEGEDIKAAIGLYPLKFVAAGRELKVGGIGNVAVTRDSRGKGYMIDRLNACLDIMKADGTVYSPLGGHRQRYGYFGYEPAGVSVCFSINKRNIRHVLGGEVKTSLTARELTEADTELLAKVKALYETQPFHAVRPDEVHIDILRSWRSTPYVALADGSFAGYFVISRDGGIAEIMAAPGTGLLDLIICTMETSGRDSASFALPPYDTENCEYMAKICASCSLTHSEMINIFDFAAFIEAFLTVKAQRMKLGSGSTPRQGTPCPPSPQVGSPSISMPIRRITSDNATASLNGGCFLFGCSEKTALLRSERGGWRLVYDRMIII